MSEVITLPIHVNFSTQSRTLNSKGVPEHYKMSRILFFIKTLATNNK